MKTCCFFGHRDSPDRLKKELYEMIELMINEYGVKYFYVGNNGNFDRMVYSLLDEAKLNYPFIKYNIVLAYHPGKKSMCGEDKYKDTIVADGLEKAPPGAPNFAPIFSANKSHEVEQFPNILKKHQSVLLYLNETCGW